MRVRLPRTARYVCLLRLVALTVAIVGATSLPAFAQDTSTHWGVNFSFTPQWEISDSVRKVIYEANDEGTMKGREISIGFVRGSMRGGDWGLSFVRKPFDDESGVVTHDQDCFNQAQTICRPRTETNQFQTVYLNAFEVHWFKSVVTIAHRAQVGFVIGGGLGTMNGNVLKTTDRFEATGFNQNGPTGFTPVHEEEVSLAKDELLPYFPLIKLEAAGAVAVARGLKVKVAVGLNFPATSVRVGAVYLIGAN